MNISVEPRKNRGVTSKKLTVEMTTATKLRATKIPIHLDLHPVRYVNIVWLKMYDPVNPPRQPETKLDMPTVINSVLTSNASPISIEIAATSKQDENETTNTIPGNEEKHYALRNK